MDSLNKNPPKYPPKIMSQNLQKEIKDAYIERAHKPGGELYRAAKLNFERMRNLF